MAKQSYDDLSTLVARVIDLAVEAVTKFPPNGFAAADVEHFIRVYNQHKHETLNPLPQFRKVASANQTMKDILIFFQESNGQAVNYFWEQISQAAIPIKRENKMAKILKRKRIKDRAEFDFLIDVLVPYQQGGMLTEEDVKKVNQMISEFERKKSK
jgi:hypothetical protein